MPSFHSALAILLLALIQWAPPPAGAAAANHANEVASAPGSGAGNRPSTRIGVAVWRPGVAAHSKGDGLKGVGPLRRYLSCACSDGGVCGCCAPVQAPQVGFDQNVCLNLTFVPHNLTVFVDVLVGDTPVVHTSFSGNNPPPLCLPVPQVPFLALCVRLQDVGLEAGPSVHACPALEVQVASNPLLVVGFDCIRVSSQGVTVMPRSRAMPLPFMGAYVPASQWRQPNNQALVT